jgi:signal transduction histidine kinase
MKLNQKILLLIVFSLLIFYFIHETTTYLVNLNQFKKDLFLKNEILFTTIEQMQQDSMKSLSLILANDSEVRKAYLKNDPQIIIEHINPFWEKAKKENLVYEIHFFKPPAQSFVNFSDFKSIGKDVSSARTDIVWVTSSFQSSTHTMMCKTYAGLRATFPIISDGKMLGGLSIGKKIDWLPRIIKNVSKSDTFLIYDLSSTKTLNKKYYDNFMKDKQIVGEFILADRTIEISEDAIKKINFKENIQNISIKGKTYSLNIFKINDFNKNGLGYLCILNDLDKFNQNFFERIMKNIFLLFIVSILIYLLFRNKITTIIDKINNLRNITYKLKENKFDLLDDLKNNKNKCEYDELSRLTDDIIAMGKSLEIHNNHLEEEVSKRTKELEYEKNYIKNILDLTPDITLVTNGKKLISANQRFYDFLEFKNLESFLSVHDCICDYFISINGEAFSKTKMIDNQIWSIYMAHHQETVHTVLLEKDEKLYYLDGRVIFINDEDVLVTLHDITELKKKDNLLFEQSKMAAMGEMIGNIAHQWRQPLSLIATSATGMIMQKEYGMLTDEIFINSCETINRNAQYLSQTIEDFKNFIKGERTKKSFNLKENIESFMKLVEGTIKSNNLNIVLNLDENIYLNSYPNEINQCLINLFNNSKDVLKEIEEDDRYIFIDTYLEGNNVVITLKDSGGGIPQEVLPKIFEPYFTTKHKSQGTGLGLHMTYNLIVDGFNGSIKPSNIDIEIGDKILKGACMTIKFPAE